MLCSAVLINLPWPTAPPPRPLPMPSTPSSWGKLWIISTSTPTLRMWITLSRKLQRPVRPSAPPSGAASTADYHLISPMLASTAQPAAPSQTATSWSPAKSIAQSKRTHPFLINWPSKWTRTSSLLNGGHNSQSLTLTSN